MVASSKHGQRGSHSHIQVRSGQVRTHQDFLGCSAEEACWNFMMAGAACLIPVGHPVNPSLCPSSVTDMAVASRPEGGQRARRGARNSQPLELRRSSTRASAACAPVRREALGVAACGGRSSRRARGGREWDVLGEKEKRCAMCWCVLVCVCMCRTLQVEGRRKFHLEAAGKSSDVARAPPGPARRHSAAGCSKERQQERQQARGASPTKPICHSGVLRGKPRPGAQQPPTKSRS